MMKATRMNLRVRYTPGVSSLLCNGYTKASCRRRNTYLRISQLCNSGKYHSFTHFHDVAKWFRIHSLNLNSTYIVSKIGCHFGDLPPLKAIPYLFILTSNVHNTIQLSCKTSHCTYKMGSRIFTNSTCQLLFCFLLFTKRPHKRNPSMK